MDLRTAVVLSWTQCTLQFLRPRRAPLPTPAERSRSPQPHGLVVIVRRWPNAIRAYGAQLPVGSSDQQRGSPSAPTGGSTPLLETLVRAPDGAGGEIDPLEGPGVLTDEGTDGGGTDRR